eukprot:TRINITY_DN78508_c0_g1_i1.p1 TRINITY_DN78508_c0_g1~~TRINITY_DN78508_c0_g1_i1.p1  ORF type:complete len:719 (+),score=149.01 TRINITY_DN78508_c0_g1_i1:99-2255(+)
MDTGGRRVPRGPIAGQGSPFRCARAVAKAAADVALKAEEKIGHYSSSHDELMQAEPEELEDTRCALTLAWRAAQQQVPAATAPCEQLSPRSSMMLEESQEPCPGSDLFEKSSSHDCSRRRLLQQKAYARVGKAPPPHRPLDLNRPIPTPPPSRPPARQSSPARRPRPFSAQCREASCESGRGCQQRSPSRLPASTLHACEDNPPGVAAVLCDFTERLHSFILTLMGFHHPHIKRLRVALDQQVDALSQGLTSVLVAKDALYAMRSAARENGLWEKLKEYRQRLLRCCEETQQAWAEADKEHALRHIETRALNLARHRGTAARATAARVLLAGPSSSEFLLQACLAAWRRRSSVAAATRCAAWRASLLRLSASNEVCLHASFAAWRSLAQARAGSRSLAEAQDEALRKLSEAQQEADGVAEQRLRQARDSLATVLTLRASEADQQQASRCLAAWHQHVLKARCQSLKERAEAAELAAAGLEEAAEHLAAKWDGRLQHLSQRFQGAGRHSAKHRLKVTFLSWAAEARGLSKQRERRNVAVQVASYGSELLCRQRLLSLLRCTLLRWQGVARGSAEAKERESIRQQAAEERKHRSDTAERTVAECVQPPSRQPEVFQGAWQPWQLAPTLPQPWRPPLEAKMRNSWDPVIVPSEPVKEEWSIHGRAATCPEEPGTQALLPEAVKHWCLASQASASEEGYLELLEYHRQRARQERRSNAGSGR